MKLEFERWIEAQRIEKEALEFFEEAIICFKVSAYRGAFMLSYLGFQTIIKERLLISERPESIPEETWETIRSNLRDTTKWDRAVNDVIAFEDMEQQGNQSRPSKQALMINRDVRKDAVFWKDKRNACVHAKDEISYPHVEAFWMFLKNHLGKFIVNSGVEGFVKQVRIHFDPRVTDPNDDFTYLIERIPSVVHNDQYDELFKQLGVALPLHERARECVKNFWRSIAISVNENVRERFHDYLKNDLEKFSLFISEFPEVIARFSNEDNIRPYWNHHLHNYYLYSSNLANLGEILTWLFNNNKIMEDEREMFWEKIVTGTRKQLFGGFSQFPDDFKEILKKYGFFKTYRQQIFSMGIYYHYDQNPWYNHEYLFPMYLTHGELDEDVVKKMNSDFRRLNSGAFLSAVREAIDANNGKVREEYREICNNLGIESYY